MSREALCATCPLNIGFEEEKLEACGDPTPRCADLRGKLVERIKAWNRLSEVANSVEDGVFNTNLLNIDDFVQLISTTAGTPYGEDMDRSLTVQVLGRQQAGVHVKVIHDSYEDSSEDLTDAKSLERRYYVVAKDSELVIQGAKIGKHTLQDELHVGRPLYYVRNVENPEQAEVNWGLNLQEVFLWDRSNVRVALFNTDPTEYRPPEN